MAIIRTTTLVFLALNFYLQVQATPAPINALPVSSPNVLRRQAGTADGLAEPAPPASLPGPRGNATFTYYQLDEPFIGACACQPETSWQSELDTPFLTAAPSNNIYQLAGKTCGNGCGTCFLLTYTCRRLTGEPFRENCPLTQANVASALPGWKPSVIVMVTNLCPADAKNPMCHIPSPDPKKAHVQGHFDIAAPPAMFERSKKAGASWGQNHWDNVLVDFEPTPCPGDRLSAYSSGCKCKAGGEAVKKTNVE